MVDAKILGGGVVCFGTFGLFVVVDIVGIVVGASSLVGEG
jgi:hypothetical protein